MNCLVFNAGSSSLKYALFDDAEKNLAGGTIDFQKQKPDYGGAVAQVLGELSKQKLQVGIGAIGHRVVHGGIKFRESIRIDADVLKEIDALTELAPLHNPPALEVIRAAQKAFPTVPQFAAFDTAFYASLAPEQFLYPVPYDWYKTWGIRRFGFHGISHSYALGRAATLLKKPPESLHLVSCHLGQGCSATATSNGKAIATTMGFTPMDGLMMGTRPGSLDPGLLLYVQKKHGLSAGDLEDVLNHKAGMLGISEKTSDVRTLEQSATEGDKQATLALTMFAVRVRAAIGSLAVTLGKIDTLVFTGGIGEHSAVLRAQIMNGLDCLGVTIDHKINQTVLTEGPIHHTDSSVSVLVIRAQEELMIAREVKRLSRS